MLFDTIVLWENAWLSATQSMRQHLCDAMGLSNLCYTYDDELVKFLAVENRPLWTALMRKNRRQESVRGLSYRP